MKEEKFMHTRKPLHWRGWGMGSFRAMEESAATGVWTAKWTESCTEDRCRPALLSLRHLSARLPGQVGVWVSRLGLRRSDPRERTGVGCVKTA